MKQREVFWDLLGGAQHRLLRRAKPMRHRLTGGILLLVLVAEFGCVSSEVDKRSASSLLFPVPKAVFQEFGRVAIVSGRFAPEFTIDDQESTPKTFEFNLMQGLGAFGPGAMGVGLAIALVLVIPLVIYEAMMAEPTLKSAEMVDERVAAARELIVSQRLQDDLRDRVVAISRVKMPPTLTVLTDQGPTAVDERPGYRLLSQEGIQTVLEVVVESVTLNCDGKWSTSSLLRMDLIVRIRLIRTVDDERIYLNWVTYKGGKERTMEEWVSDPEGLRDELNRAYTDIAERTVEEVFLRTESN